MKFLVAVAAFTLVGTSLAFAQTDMSCADLMKMNASLDAATKAEAAKDPTAAAMDAKINAYCAKNPTAKASEAMEKALQ